MGNRTGGFSTEFFRRQKLSNVIFSVVERIFPSEHNLRESRTLPVFRVIKVATRLGIEPKNISQDIDVLQTSPMMQTLLESSIVKIYFGSFSILHEISFNLCFSIITFIIFSLKYHSNINT